VYSLCKERENLKELTSVTCRGRDRRIILRRTLRIQGLRMDRIHLV
jgi:hypothetical protein